MIDTLRKKAKSCFQSQHGEIIVLWALMLPIIIGFIGIGVEISLWYARQADLQAAADAAAIAGAYQLTALQEKKSTTTIVTVVDKEMNRNGFGASAQVSITVNNPPATGVYAGNKNAVEVIASQPQKALFSALFRTRANTIGVRSVALRNPSSNNNGCIIALNAFGRDILSNGNTITMPGCSMVANSTSGEAIALNGATLTLENIYTAGGISNNGSAIHNSSPSITDGSVVPDPFANVPMPSFTHNCMNPPKNGVFNPGVYCGGIALNGSSERLNSGLYIIDGGSLLVNGGSLTGDGVTIVLTNNATVTFNGGAHIALSAPTSTNTDPALAPYVGMLFYDDRASSGGTQIFNGDSNMDLTGALYFPNSTVFFNGGSARGSCTQVIASRITFNGSTSISPAHCPAGTSLPSVPSGMSNIRIKE